MNTKQLGDIAETQVIAALVKQGKNVLLPVGDRNRYDLVVEENGKFYRVQVKSGRLENGSVEFNTTSTTTENGKVVQRGYVGSVEFIAVYCHNNGTSYLVPIKDCGASTTRLVVNEKHRKNQWTYKLAKDYIVT